MPSICVLTPAKNYEENWSALEADYRRLFGDSVAFRPWTEPGDLSKFDLVSPLIAWGYQRDCAAWFGLLDGMESDGVNVCNPVRILRWNSDKKIYLRDLSEADVPIVPTRLAQSLSTQDIQEARNFFGFKRLVIKPPISGGADGTYLLNAGDPLPDMAVGQTMLVQPFLPFIAEEGELSLFYFGGNYSHAIVKRPAAGDFRVQEQFGGREQKIEPTENSKALAQKALAAASCINAIDGLPYARIDMIRDWEGKFILMELELIEPSLFLQYAPDKGAAFAHSLISAAR